MSTKSEHKRMKQKLLSIAHYLNSHKAEDNEWYGGGLELLGTWLGTTDLVHY